MTMETLGCSTAGKGGGYIGLANKKFGYLKCFNLYYFTKYIVIISFTQKCYPVTYYVG